MKLLIHVLAFSFLEKNFFKGFEQLNVTQSIGNCLMIPIDLNTVNIQCTYSIYWSIIWCSQDLRGDILFSCGIVLTPI